MSDDRKNLKISEDTFSILKESKPGGVTWDYYLRDLHAEGRIDD